MEIIERSSPNFGPRRGGARPDMVVIHHTAMVDAEAALARLCDPEAEVSAHYLISAAGKVWALVPEAERAWHAGAGRWGAVEDVNSRSIGIELDNPGPLREFPPFAEPQMAALEDLLDGIMARWSVPPERVIAHSDMAPGRKADPGPKLDWRRLALGGRAVWVEAGPAEPATFRRAAERAGYRAPEGDARAVLDAFRLRFRPQGRGADPDATDAGLMAALAETWPCVDGGGLPT